MTTKARIAQAFTGGAPVGGFRITVLSPDAVHDADVLSAFTRGPTPLQARGSVVGQVTPSGAAVRTIRDSLAFVSLQSKARMAVVLDPYGARARLGWGAKGMAPIEVAELLHGTLSRGLDGVDTVECWIDREDKEAKSIAAALGFEERPTSWMSPLKFALPIKALKRPASLSHEAVGDLVEANLIAPVAWLLQVIDLRKPFWGGDASLAVGNGLTLHLAGAGDVDRMGPVSMDRPDRDVARDVELGRYLLARDMTGAIVSGARILETSPGVARIEVVTAADKRREGHARTTLEAACRTLFRNGASSVDAIVDCDDDASEALCESCGFLPSSVSYPDSQDGRSWRRTATAETLEHAVQCRAGSPAP